MKRKDVKHSISRRQFIKQSTISLAGISALGFAACGDSATNPTNSQTSLRVIAYNLFLGSSWPTDRNLGEKAVKKGQMPTRLAFELALYEPDIVAFSEAPEESVVEEIADLLNLDYVYFRSVGTSAGSWPGAILTHYEIENSENVPTQEGQRPDGLFTRHWGKATIRLTNNEEVIVYSAHLNPHDDRDNREREIDIILESIQSEIDNGKSVLLLGDLNHTPESMPEYNMWMDAGWVDTFAEVGEGDGSTRRPDYPSGRIDYVLAHGPIAEKLIAARTLFEGAFRTNPEDPQSFALSDHLPVFAEFEIDDIN